MKLYDIEKAKKIVESKKTEIESCHIGIHEDWFWTAKEFYNLEDGFYGIKKGDSIGGIHGSSWGTPVIELQYKNGENETLECFIHESDQGDKPSFFTFGCLSEPIQNKRDLIEIGKFKEQE